MNDREKNNKNTKETSDTINKIIDYNKDAQNSFHRASKVDKKNQNQRLEKVLRKG